jgi:Zea mays MURB-like protein (MuDR).
MHKQIPTTHLQRFLARRSLLIVGASIGAVLSAFASQLAPGTAAYANESQPKFIISEKLEQIIAQRASKNVDNVEVIKADYNLDSVLPKFEWDFANSEREAIEEVITDKRARLENAMRELEILEEMVAEAERLPDAERDELISSAVTMYNEALGGTEFTFADGFENKQHASIAPSVR